MTYNNYIEYNTHENTYWSLFCNHGQNGYEKENDDETEQNDRIYKVFSGLYVLLGNPCPGDASLYTDPGGKVLFAGDCEAVSAYAGGLYPGRSLRDRDRGTAEEDDAHSDQQGLFYRKKY